MESKDHARIHPGRRDSNRRPRGSRRRTTSRLPPSWVPSVEEAQDLGDEAFEERFKACQVDWTTEAGDESLDGLHQDETPEA